MNNPIIEIDGVPFLIGDAQVKRVEVSAINYEPLTALVSRVSAVASPEDYGKLVERARLIAQSKFIGENGVVLTPTDMQLLQMPVVYARRIHKAMSSIEQPKGEIVRDGDGIITPILYKLGTPLETATSKITELEFLAKTLGDIEDVLYRSNTAEQTIALLTSVAVPVGTEEQLMSLPSWALSQITVTDGAIISQKVLPRFLD